MACARGFSAVLFGDVSIVPRNSPAANTPYPSPYSTRVRGQLYLLGYSKKRKTMSNQCGVCAGKDHRKYPSFAMDVDELRRSSSSSSGGGSSDRGCTFCALLLKAVAAIQSHTGKVAKNVEGEWDRVYFTNMTVTLTFEDGEKSGDYEFYNTKGKDYPAPFDGIWAYSHYSADSGSDETVSWVKKRLQNCYSPAHTDCPPATGATLPTRVLDLGAPDGGVNHDSNLQLYEPEGKSAQYVCLSHCWGGIHPLSTTISTREDHLKEILWSKLPKTFQDVISFARRLGFQYLWVDSLCIVQDDIDDWRREAATMCDVYRGATLVIAASLAKNSNESCFSNEPFLMWHQDISQELEDGELLHVSIRKGHFHSTALSWPLCKRAWVFQEQILAQRVLHFLHGEVCYQCRVTDTYQCGYGPLGSNHYRLKLKESFDWWTWVQYYTGLDISHKSDKLPAIGGLARFFVEAHPELKGTYLAGLWKGKLLTDLCWDVSYGFERRPKPEKWRAPSWTWVSCDGSVLNVTTLEDPVHVKVLEANCVLKSADPYGEVVSGYLVLSSDVELIEVHLRGRPKEREDNWKWPGWLTDFSIGPLKNGRWIGMASDYLWEKSPQWVEVPETVYFQHEESFSLFPLFGRYFLLLRRVADQQATFERVGRVLDYNNNAVDLVSGNIVVKIM